jgi:hypothetical protein
VRLARIKRGVGTPVNVKVGKAQPQEELESVNYLIDDPGISGVKKFF